MISKRHLVFNFVMIIFPWLSLLLLGKKNIKRFFPASFVTIILEMITEIIGMKRKWWIFFDKPKSFLTNELFFSLGPFLIGAMWILKLTYGNFKRFLMINAAVDAFFSYVLTSFLKKVKIAKLYKFSGFHFFVYMFSKAFLLYGAQWYFDQKTNLTRETE